VPRVRGWSGNLDVLRLRDFRLLLAGQTVSVFGDRMAVVALAFAVLEVGGSASAVGLVMAAAIAPMVASVLVGGVVADRVSRRSVMVVADVARIASQGAMAGLLIAGAAEVWMLAGLAGVTGAASGFFNPASTGLLPEVVEPDELQPANALRATAVSASEIGGPLVAGLLVATAGAGWAIGADALTFAASAACLVRLRVPARAARQTASFVRDLRDGWDAFRARRWVWSFVVYFGFGNTLWAAYQVLGPVVADRELGGAGAWGAVLGANGVGLLVGSLVATSVRPGRPLVLVAAMEALFGLPIAFLAAGAPLVLLAGGALLSGIGVSVGMAVWESTLQRHIPRETLSRVVSYDWFASYVFSPVGLAIWGPVSAALGVGVTLWVAFALFAAAVATLLALPDIRHMRGA
jgi:MFS family permease